MHRPLLTSLTFGLVALGGLCVGCDSSGGDETSVTESSSTLADTVGTTTSAAPLPPPPLTHGQFIRKFDHLCKVGNRASGRRFEFGTIYDTPESMDAFAAKLAKFNRYIRNWDRKHGFFTLDPGDPQDVRNYERYKVFWRRIANYSGREVLAARRHDFEELLRLFRLEDRTRNQRTRLTADMGLRYCGA
jgi:hypothetical protein